MAHVHEQLLGGDVERVAHRFRSIAAVKLRVNVVIDVHELLVVGLQNHDGLLLGRHAIFEREHRDVVGLLGVEREIGDRTTHANAHRTRVHVGILAQGLHEAVLSEQVALGIHRLGNAISIEIEHVADVELPRIGIVGDAVEQPERHARNITHPFPFALVQHERRVVPCVNIRELAGVVIQDAGEHGHEHARIVADAELMVRRVNGLPDGKPRLHVVFHLGLRAHHEQRRRDALARHVGQYEAELVVVIADEEEVVKITADLLGRFHRSVDVELVDLRERRELARQS